MTLVPIAAFWAVALWGLGSKRPVLLMLFFATLPMGTLAVVPPGLAGGFSLVASSVAALLLAVKQLMVRIGGTDEVIGLALSSAPGRLLVAFWSVATVVTAFAPRLFTGEIDVIAMSSPELGPVPLAPTPQNVSQWVYLTASVLAVFTFAAYFRHRHHRQLLFDGLLFAGAVTVATGILDLASSFVPLDWLLRPFRTAEYSITESQQLQGGSERVIGLMSEPAAFAGVSIALLSLLYYLRQVPEDPRRRRWCNRLLVGLVLMVVLSTSSSGFLGLGVLVALVGVDWLLRSSGAVQLAAIRLGTTRELKVGLVLASAVVAAAIFTPSVFDPVVDRVEVLLFDKTGSDSFEERSLWTRVSFEAGVSSYLLGVGLGSTRASNYAAVLFASTGLAGIGLYAAFAVSLLRQRLTAASGDVLLGRAMKWSFAPTLAVALTVGTTPDFGRVDALRWGVLLGLICQRGTGVERPNNPPPSRLVDLRPVTPGSTLHSSRMLP